LQQPSFGSIAAVQALRLHLNLFARRYVAALHSFTQLPLRGGLQEWAALEPETVEGSARHFPGVGLLVGMAACVVFAVVSLPLPPSALSPFVAAVLATLATLLLTGATHELGLFQWADAQQRTGDPLQDGSASPALGAIGLVLVLALKFSLLAVLGAQSAGGVMAALLAGHVVSRFWPLVLAGVDRHSLLIAGLWCAIPMLLMVFADGMAFLLVALVVSGLAFLAVRQRAIRRGESSSVSTLGATQQICEVAFYLGAAFGLLG
jgi:adenosylcobinamide-GDP ribazoletransferase